MYDLYESIVRKSITYMEEHLVKDVTAEEVARHCAVSKWHFYRIFQKITGMGVAEYLRNRRLTYAAQDLVNTDWRIIDIAVTYRFSTQESFTRAFKKMFAMTPHQYRQYFSEFYIVEEDVPMKMPKGWIASGSHPAEYEMGTDQNTVHSGKAAGYIASTATTSHHGFGTMMQMFNAQAYRGKRLRLSAFLKTEEVSNWAALWMRIDGANGDMLGFDNMEQRPLTGTSEWNQYAIILDIPQESTAIAFGILLSGSGEVWIDTIRFDEVDENVPTTDMLAGDGNRLPDEPLNLHFED
ncbi:helix-turn-helix transcriptional regulator [Aneurinibacillus sp. REN35]|uniref:helix-turn-helix transcriptional regulator n=1 Tax=Aneurinibacillus sp. REN35 TaxID=3237286 RepID=UPI003528E0B7